jgi:hypothetical protein
MSDAQRELKQRAGRALVAYAVFRVESALTIGGTLLLVFFLSKPFVWWLWWYWLVIGGLFEALIIYTSVADERTGQKVVGEMLRERYDPRTLRDPHLREQARQALDYRAAMDKLIEGMPAGVLRDHLRDDSGNIANWIGYIHAIAQRLDTFKRDALISRDMQTVPSDLTRLRQQLAKEDDANVRRQIEATIAAKQGQYDNLRALQNQMEQASFRLDETLTSLGAVYSQMQLLQARKDAGSRSERLSGDIRDQVQRLQDILTSMDEVYERDQT